MAITTDDRFVDVDTSNLIIDLVKVHLELRADGSALRRLQKKVGDNKVLRDGITDELAKRKVSEGVIGLPFGHTMESLFSPSDVEAEGDE